MKPCLANFPFVLLINLNPVLLYSCARTVIYKESFKNKQYVYSYFCANWTHFACEILPVLNSFSQCCFLPEFPHTNQYPVYSAYSGWYIQGDSGLVQLLNYSCENICCANTAKVFISNMSGKKIKRGERSAN